MANKPHRLLEQDYSEYGVGVREITDNKNDITLTSINKYTQEKMGAFASFILSEFTEIRPLFTNHNEGGGGNLKTDEITN